MKLKIKGQQDRQRNYCEKLRNRNVHASHNIFGYTRHFVFTQSGKRSRPKGSDADNLIQVSGCQRSRRVR